MASAVLLAGFANPAEELPLDQQPPAQPDGGRPIKAKGTASSAHDKAPAKVNQSEDLAAKANGVLSVVISIDKQQLTLYSDGYPIGHSRVSTGVR